MTATATHNFLNPIKRAYLFSDTIGRPSALKAGRARHDWLGENHDVHGRAYTPSRRLNFCAGWVFGDFVRTCSTFTGACSGNS